MHLLNIPGFGELAIQYLVFDLNGTLALDGIMSAGTKEHLKALAETFEIHIISSDTNSTLHSQVKDLPVKGVVIEGDATKEVKKQYVEDLGEETVIAIGNGNNDMLMLQTAAIGIAVIGPEGASAKAVSNADLVFSSIEDMLAALTSPRRLVSGLRG
jgi:soluble P-type ATPase